MGSATYVCSIFVCPDNGVWLLVFRTVNVRTGVGHATAHGGCTDTVRESALEADSEKNCLPYRGLELASV